MRLGEAGEVVGRVDAPRLDGDPAVVDDLLGVVVVGGHELLLAEVLDLLVGGDGLRALLDLTALLQVAADDERLPRLLLRVQLDRAADVRAVAGSVRGPSLLDVRVRVLGALELGVLVSLEARLDRMREASGILIGRGLERGLV